MQVNTVPPAVRERMGSEGTAGLLQMLDLAGRDWRQDVLSLAAERFDRRLGETASSFRVQLAESEAALRQELGQLEAGVRQGMNQLESGLRQDMAQLEVRILRAIANGRVDWLKWSFLFWIGQVIAMSAIVGTMLRIVR